MELNILLHQCCGPCSIYPISFFKKENIKVTAFFSNYNIHGANEFMMRLNAAVDINQHFGVDYLVDADYGLNEFLLNNPNDNKRCLRCYETRLRKTAEKAKELKFTHFSSSLLYSKMQKHDEIKRIAENIASEYGISFYYKDFREGWQEAINISKELGVYRQNYCGCIYSEHERFEKKLLKTFDSFSVSKAY